MVATHRLDVLGEMCPFPNIKTKNFVIGMPEGDTLIVETDHSCAVTFIADDMELLGMKYWVEEDAPGIWQVFIQKGEKKGED